MNHKAFTLAELMAVVVILAIISIIAITAVSRNIQDSRYETCLAQEKNIIEGAKTWSIDNASKLPGAGGTTTINLRNDLQNSNPVYVEDLVSPMTNTSYSAGTTIKITSPNGTSYDYEITYGNAAENCTK